MDKQKPEFKIPHLASFFQIHEYRQRSSDSIAPRQKEICPLSNGQIDSLSGPVRHLVKNRKPLNAKGANLLKRWKDQQQ